MKINFSKTFETLQSKLIVMYCSIIALISSLKIVITSLVFQYAGKHPLLKVAWKTICNDFESVGRFFRIVFPTLSGPQALFV